MEEEKVVLSLDIKEVPLLRKAIRTLAESLPENEAYLLTDTDQLLEKLDKAEEESNLVVQPDYE